MTPTCALAEAVGSLPAADDPLALALNENPFPPLPAVRAALTASIGAVNRYPEFLPQRLRSLIAGRVGVADEQVLVGAGRVGEPLDAVVELVRETGRLIFLRGLVVQGEGDSHIVLSFAGTIRKASSK